MPYGYGGYGSFNNPYFRGYNDLFGGYGDSLIDTDINIDEEELRKAQEAIDKNKNERQNENAPLSRKQRLIQALPYIAAALTAEDGGEVSRAVLSFANFQADMKKRQEEFERQRKLEQERQQSREEEREDVQEFQSEQAQLGREFQTRERESKQRFSKSERLDEQLFDLSRDDRKFRQDLIKMGYSTELSQELEEIQHNYRVVERQQGFEQNSELFRRQVSEDLANRMDQAGINLDVARSLSDKVTQGVPYGQLSYEEQVGLDLYNKWSKTNSEYERNRALLETTLSVMNTEVPVEGASIDPITGRVPTRKLDPSEVLPFVTKDPVSALQNLLSPKDFNSFETSSGESVGKVKDDAVYNNTTEWLSSSSDPVARTIKEEASRITNDVRATEFAVALYQSYGLTSAKAMVDNLSVDPKYRPLMIQAIEEADIISKERKLQQEQLLNNPTGHFNEFNRF